MERNRYRFQRRELKPVSGQAAGFCDPAAFVVLGTLRRPQAPRQRLCLWTPLPARAGLIADAQLSAGRKEKCWEEVAVKPPAGKHGRSPRHWQSRFSCGRFDAANAG